MMWDWSMGYGHEPVLGGHSLGPEYLLTDNDQLVALASSHGASGGGHSEANASAPAGTGSPTSTLVGSSGGLQIDLVWDTSVQDNANWSAIEASVVAAAKIYTNTFSTPVVVNIDVGYGEVAGSALGGNDLGESESSGYIANYATVESALSISDHGLVQSGLMSSNAAAALSGLRGENFFIPSAEAKAMGLVGASSQADGYIGLNSTSLMFFGAAGQTVPSGRYDATGVAAHEISEVLGRIGMEGETLSTYRDVYTPLDVFRYSAAHVADTRPTSGYFSLSDGVSSLGTYNNPANGGDASDWASLASDRLDAYDAFDNPGVTTQVTTDDLLEVASLGYAVKPGASLATETA